MLSKRIQRNLGKATVEHLWCWLGDLRGRNRWLGGGRRRAGHGRRGLSVRRGGDRPARALRRLSSLGPGSVRPRRRRRGAAAAGRRLVALRKVAGILSMRRSCRIAASIVLRLPCRMHLQCTALPSPTSTGDGRATTGPQRTQERQSAAPGLQPGAVAVPSPTWP
jgi:hypothetical protein